MGERRWTDTVSVWELEQARGERGDRRCSEQTRSGEKQKDSGHEQTKIGANGLAHLLIRLSNSVWSHEPAVGFMGLIMLIYLVIYHTPGTIYLSVSIRPGHKFPFNVYKNAWLCISIPNEFSRFADGNVIFAYPQISDFCV